MAVLTHRTTERAIELFHALSDETRLEIIELLRKGERCVCELTDTLDSRGVLDRIEKIPGLRKRAEELARATLDGLNDPDAREAATASAAEFILEGLHVHNKLNKNVKAGTTSYKR